MRWRWCARAKPAKPRAQRPVPDALPWLGAAWLPRFAVGRGVDAQVVAPLAAAAPGCAVHRHRGAAGAQRTARGQAPGNRDRQRLPHQLPAVLRPVRPGFAGTPAHPLPALVPSAHGNHPGASVSQRLELERRGFERLELLARGVDACLFNPARRSQALRESWGLGPDDLAVLHVGRLAVEKNLGLLRPCLRHCRRLIHRSACA